MKLRTFTLAGLIFLLAAVTLSFSQDPDPQPCPDVTAGIPRCELIAWSQLQEPVPRLRPAQSHCLLPMSNSIHNQGKRVQPFRCTLLPASSYARVAGAC